MENERTENASIFMEYFFGLKKSSGGSKPKFKLEDKDLEKPLLVKKYAKLEDRFYQVSKISKGEGIDFGKFRPENLIDTDFLIKSVDV